MFRPLELYAGLKYTRAKRRNHFISFISSISMGGIALAVMLLITVLSVMNGFEAELRDRILGMASHVEISGGRGALQNWQDVESQVDERVADVNGAAPYISGEGMVRTGRNMAGTMIRGVLPEQERNVSDVADHMVAGDFESLEKGKYRIVIGAELAAILGVGLGDKIDLMIPEANITPAGIVPRFRRFTVGGIFQVGMYEYDRGMVMIHMGDAATLYNMKDGVTGVRLHLKDMFDAPSVSRQLEVMLDPGKRVSDWTRQHANFFHAIATEKTVMFIILSLIIAVAAFNIVSMLVMVVTDKQGNIAILRTLGMSPKSVMAIFMVQGSLIGIVGTVSGCILGVLAALNVSDMVAWLERVLGIQFLSSDVYFISYLPSRLEMSDLGVIVSSAFGLTFLSTLYPAWRAARIQPAEVLRYE